VSRVCSWVQYQYYSNGNEPQTLETIAVQFWGDASLWHLIADANGLNGPRDPEVKVGRTLLIPNQVANVRNAADTFKPYNPSKIIGDVTPTLPLAPPAKNSCTAAQILVVAIAVVASYGEMAENGDVVGVHGVSTGCLFRGACLLRCSVRCLLLAWNVIRLQVTALVDDGEDFDVCWLDLIQNTVGVERNLPHGVFVQLRPHASEVRQFIEANGFVNEGLGNPLGIER